MEQFYWMLGQFKNFRCFCFMTISYSNMQQISIFPHLNFRFPQGIKFLSNYVHDLGLKFGLYSNAGYRTCGGVAGSLGFEENDVKLFLDYDIDYLKYDNCYPKVVSCKECLIWVCFETHKPELHIGWTTQAPYGLWQESSSSSELLSRSSRAISIWGHVKGNSIGQSDKEYYNGTLSVWVGQCREVGSKYSPNLANFRRHQVNTIPFIIFALAISGRFFLQQCNT